MVVGYHHFRKPPYDDLECVLVMACNFDTFAEKFWQFFTLASVQQIYYKGAA